MARTEGCNIHLLHDERKDGTMLIWSVRRKHYQELKEKVLAEYKGWVELEHIYGDGKLLIRVQDIVAMFDATQEYCTAADFAEEEERKEELTK